MTDPSEQPLASPDPNRVASVEMPRATVWPIVVALGVTMLGAGSATNLALSFVGAFLFILGLAGWIRQLLPGQGHMHEPLVDPARRPREIVARPSTLR